MHELPSLPPLEPTTEFLDDPSFDRELTSSSPGFFEIADRFIDLYVSYRQHFVMMMNGSIFIPKRANGSTIPLSNKLICRHLNKKTTIGIFAGEYSSKFVCFDIDDGSKETVRKVISLLVCFGIPERYIYVSSSGGKGYHVEVFFDELVYTEKLRILYDWVIMNGKLDGSKVEFRPTKSQAIKLPLSKHVKTGNICWFVNPQTFEPYAYDEYIFEIKPFSQATLNNLVDHCGLRMSVSGFDDIPGIEKYLPGPQTKELTPEEQRVFDLLNADSYPDIIKRGERHYLTRAIALYNRNQGMPEEESVKALLNWWARQDKTLTTTSDEEAIKDIHELVAWTFSEKFKLSTKKQKLTITKDMLRLTFAQKTKTERKIMFLLACYCDVYGRMSMSIGRIAEYVGCSYRGVTMNLERLIENGYITKTQGRTTRSGDTMYRKPNLYRINPDAYDRVKDVPLEFVFEEPMTYMAAEVPDSEKSRTVIKELEPEGFEEFFYLIIRRTLSEASLTKHLTDSELKALRNYKTS